MVLVALSVLKCCCGAQVTLYEAPTAPVPLNADFELTMDEPLIPGLQMAAYFAEEHNSTEFVSRVRLAVANVVAELAELEKRVGHLVEALQSCGMATRVMAKCSPHCVFELQKGDMSCFEAGHHATFLKRIAHVWCLTVSLP